MRPRIGITTSSVNEMTASGETKIVVAINGAYIHAVEMAGGMPLLLPNSPLAAPDVLDTLDGLLFSGGGDIHSAWWNESLHPQARNIVPIRDEYEIALLQEALKRDLPILGVCRGMQVLTVATGGALWQDIPSQCPDALVHQQTSQRGTPQHDVIIDPDSLLAHIYWPTGTEHYRLAVNSHHHQAARKCATILKVIAESPDGLPEAVAVTDATFVLGVQWHPEEMVDAFGEHALLFSSLIDAALARRT